MGPWHRIRGRYTIRQSFVVQASLMMFLTNFADEAVVLPVVLAIALMLAARGWWRGALAWLAAVGLTFGLVLALKLSFLACGPVFGPWRLRSPSGHTAAGAMVVGGLTALLTRRRLAVWPLALLAAIAVGISRVVLGFHSVPEVLLGGALGVAGALGLSRLAGPVPPGRRLSPLLGAILVAVLLHGTHLNAEAAIRRASHAMLDFVPACRADQARPYVSSTRTMSSSPR
jgi:membrane-associated phospholipid phosphatase